MKRRFLFTFALVGLVVASTKSYTVKLYQPALAGNTPLKEGEYQLELVDQKAVLRNGRIESQTPVRVESNDVKYGSTTVRFSNGDGKMHIQEIHLGGTRTKLVFAE